MNADDTSAADWPAPIRTEIPDERRFAPAVREWSSVRGGPTLVDRDRTALARHLWRLQMPKYEIADVLGIDWTQLDRVLAGGSVPQHHRTAVPR